MCGGTNGNEESFSRSLHNTRMPILQTSFRLCHSKLKRPVKFATMKVNFFYRLTYNSLADLGGARPARAPPFAWHPSF